MVLENRVTAVVSHDGAAQAMDEKIAERLQLYSQLEMLSSVSFAAMRQVRRRRVCVD